MRTRRMLTILSGLGVLVTTGIYTSGLASAKACDEPMNGTYTATSDGHWAKTRDVFKDEATVIATWSVKSTCQNTERCRGEVVSNQGWRADIVCNSGMWITTHRVDNWQPCIDGRSTHGDQEHKFYLSSDDPETYAGWDRTVGPSGGCGVNQWLVIVMPLKVVKSA